MIIKTDVHVFIVGVHFIIVNECILIKRDIVFEKEKEEGGGYYNTKFFTPYSLVNIYCDVDG